jgi:hypothetical protein
MFKWQPIGVYLPLLILGVPGLIIVLILVVVTRKTMLVLCPVCPAHQSHWFRRDVRKWGLFVALIIGLCAIISVGIALNDDDLVPVFIVGGVAFFVILLVAIALVETKGVRAREITTDEITLVGVHEVFADAVEDELGSPRRRRRRRQVREVDDEDDEDIPRPGARPRRD